MDTVLLMLSGGLDSVYLLHHYLTKTDHALHVHHISQRYPQLRRWMMEDGACRRIVQYCRENYRDFGYSESRFDLLPLRLVGKDSDLHLMVASKLASNLEGDRVTLAVGHLYDDDPLTPTPHRVDLVWSALRDRMYGKERINPDIAKPLIEAQITKRMVCENLPDPLLRLSWSCRKPDFRYGRGVPCGFCDTCKRIGKSFKEMGRVHDFPNLVRQPGLNEGAGTLEIAEPDVPEYLPVTSLPGANDMTLPYPGVLGVPVDPILCSGADGGDVAGDAIGIADPWLKVRAALTVMASPGSEAQIARSYNITVTELVEWKDRLKSEIDLVTGKTNR